MSILSIFVSLSYANNDLAQLMLPSSDIDMNEEKEFTQDEDSQSAVYVGRGR